MSENMSLKDAERNAVRITTQDGLWDILLGAIILALGASAILRDQLGIPWNYMPLVLVIATMIPGMRAAKKAITSPRIGMVQFSPQRKDKFKRLNSILISLVLFTFVMALLPNIINFKPGTPILPYWFVDALFGMLVVGFFAFLSIAFETPRILLYGLLFGASMPGNVILKEELGIDFPVISILAGVVILVWGIVVLVHFLRQYPIPVTGEVPNDN